MVVGLQQEIAKFNSENVKHLVTSNRVLVGTLLYLDLLLICWVEFLFGVIEAKFLYLIRTLAFD